MSASASNRRAHPGWPREVAPRWELRPAPAHPGGPDLFVVVERITFWRVPLHPDHLEQVRYRKISTPLPRAEAKAIMRAREHAADNAEWMQLAHTIVDGCAARDSRGAGIGLAALAQRVDRLTSHRA